MRNSLLLESLPDGLRDLSSSFQFCKMVKADAPALTKKTSEQKLASALSLASLDFAYIQVRG